MLATPVVFTSSYRHQNVFTASFLSITALESGFGWPCLGGDKSSLSCLICPSDSSLSSRESSVLIGLFLLAKSGPVSLGRSSWVDDYQLSQQVGVCVDFELLLSYISLARSEYCLLSSPKVLHCVDFNLQLCFPQSHFQTLWLQYDVRGHVVGCSSNFRVNPRGSKKRRRHAQKSHRRESLFT